MKWEFITVVSGLPRSGTSMMMKMLEAGGLEILTDQLRRADQDNPKGYYEYERVKKLPDGDTAWVEAAKGKTVKVISALLEHLPAQYTYKVIFMRRDMREILASQREMLIRRGESPDKVSDDKLALYFQKHLNKVAAWLQARPNIQVIDVNYKDTLQNPAANIQRLVDFLELDLDQRAMQQAIDPNLYRQRG